MPKILKKCFVWGGDAYVSCLLVKNVVRSGDVGRMVNSFRGERRIVIIGRSWDIIMISISRLDEDMMISDLVCNRYGEGGGRSTNDRTIILMSTGNYLRRNGVLNPLQ